MVLGEALNLVEMLYLARRKQFLDRVNALQNSQRIGQNLANFGLNSFQTETIQEIDENETQICKVEPESDNIEVRN